jgi:hypothetical protein
MGDVMTAFADYFLHVELLVTEDKAPEFEAQVREFIERGAFRRFDPTADLRIVGGLRTPKPFEYRPEPSGGEEGQVLTRDPLGGQRVYRYVNLWTVQSLAGLDLAPIMNASADDDLYIAIDKLVASEVQEFVVRMKWPGDEPVKRLDGSFVRVTRHFYNSRDLNVYTYDVPVIRPLQEKNGIRNIGYFQTATGRLETVTEFWQLSSESTPVDAATLDEDAKFQGATKEQLGVLAEVQAIRHEERHELYRSYL